jgi:glycosyltransferase involved in cell wall biosynthesis
VAIEAMAHGLPIVAYNLGGVGEYLSDRNGVLVAEKQSFALALKKLYNSVGTMNKMGKNSLEIVKEKFSEERFIEEFKALQEVLK